MSDTLSSSEIRSRLGVLADSLAVECVARTGSTNADLLQRLDCLDSPTLLAAEEQSAGRGRAGRSWVSPPGASLAFSLAWPFFRRSLPGLLGLPLAAGVAVAEALQECGLAVRLKWPNDILLGEGKLAGILVETGSVERAGHRVWWAVIGIGINIALPDGLEQALKRRLADAPMLMGRRNEAMAAITRRLAQMLSRFDVSGFSAFADQWNALHAYEGQQVCIFDHGRSLQEGRACGVDEQGRLLLDTASGRITVQAGDVSLRPLAASGA